MVESLGDPHTLFIEPKTAAIEQSKMQGSFEGIGATIEMREGRLTVVAPIKGSPAEKAGLKTDDIILQVDDTIIQNMDITTAVSLIRGPKGTTVTLQVQRARQAPFTLSIVRDVIRTPSVEARMIEGTSIAYIRLNEFSATAPGEMQTELKTLLAQHPTGLIFDLRQDPGGLLSAALDVTSQFVKPGQIVVVIKDKNGRSVPCADASGRSIECKTKAGGVATDIPMVILIDKGSASSSEIVAAALKDYQRAILIGVTTYGKGSVQIDHTLSDGSELNVTVAHFFSPKNNDINEVGVAPDIEIKITEEDVAAKRDAQLERAIQFLQTGK
jgi:carboxyl-terminal processing protease